MDRGGMHLLFSILSEQAFRWAHVKSGCYDINWVIILAL